MATRGPLSKGIGVSNVLLSGLKGFFEGREQSISRQAELEKELAKRQLEDIKVAADIIAKKGRIEEGRFKEAGVAERFGATQERGGKEFTQQESRIVSEGELDRRSRERIARDRASADRGTQRASKDARILVAAAQRQINKDVAAAFSQSPFGRMAAGKEPRGAVVAIESLMSDQIKKAVDAGKMDLANNRRREKIEAMTSLFDLMKKRTIAAADGLEEQASLTADPAQVQALEEAAQRLVADFKATWAPLLKNISDSQKELDKALKDLEKAETKRRGTSARQAGVPPPSQITGTTPSGPKQ